MLMKPTREVLAENLSRLMAQSVDLRSATQLARRSRVAQTTISNWLRVEEMPVLAPRLSALEAVARAFGISVGDLLTEHGNDEQRDDVAQLRAELAESRARAVKVSQQLYELAAQLGSDECPAPAKRRPFSDPVAAGPEDYLLSGGLLRSGPSEAKRRK